jgi:TRAP-type C4-dicarboxylate transport system substrate-binding protein
MVASELWSKEGGLNQQGLDFAIEHGNEVITLSEEEDARWKEKLKPLRDEYAKALDEKGIDGQAVMDKIVELTEKYNNEFN